MKNEKKADNEFKDENLVVITEHQLQKRVDGSLDTIVKVTGDLKKLKSKVDEAFDQAKKLGEKSTENINVYDIEIKKEGHWYTLGIKTKDDKTTIDTIRQYLIEQNKVVVGIADAQRDAEKVISDILKYQQDLAKEMKNLYGLGIVSLQQCRFVSKSILARLHKAAEERIDEIEVECLNQVLQDLKKQEEQLGRFATMADDIESNQKNIKNNKKELDEHDEELERQRRVDAEHDEELERQRRVDNEHDEELERQRRVDNEHDEELERQRQIDDELKHKCEALLKRVELLEKGSLPLGYKIAIGFSMTLSICALILAIIH